MVIQKLTNVQGVPLVTVKDGKYDISVLSEFISTKIGADNTLSRQSNKADSELESIRAEFRKQGVELTKRDTRQLVKFCGYHVEYKNYMLGLYDATIIVAVKSASIDVLTPKINTFISFKSFFVFKLTNSIGIKA